MKPKSNFQYFENRKPEELREDFAFKYLHKQFPWLSENEIMEAIELKGPNADHVIKYLDDKSGKRTIAEDQDY